MKHWATIASALLIGMSLSLPASAQSGDGWTQLFDGKGVPDLESVGPGANWRVENGELVGMLSLGQRRSGRDYSSDDRRLLDGLAKRAAPPMRVAQLVRDLVRQQALELHARERIEQEPPG